jgi:hypothetical protein
VPKRFTDSQELVRCAQNFLQERCASLQKDVAHCLTGAFAPFPAILYCFSTIDLLGALSAGDASRHCPTTKQSADYMQRFMNYTQQQAELLQQLFRHKLVHAAQPRAVVKYSGKIVSWGYEHDNWAKHLLIEDLPAGCKVTITPTWEISRDQIFWLSIMDFARDVCESVGGPNGYLSTLERTPDLQDRFEKALNHLFDPSQ